MTYSSIDEFRRLRVETAYRMVPSSGPYIRDANDVSMPLEHRLACADEGYTHTANTLNASYIAVVIADTIGGPDLDPWRAMNQTALKMAHGAFPRGPLAPLRLHDVVVSGSQEKADSRFDEARLRRIVTAHQLVPSSVPYIRDANDVSMPLAHRLRCAEEGYTHTLNALNQSYIAVLIVDTIGGPEFDSWRSVHQTVLKMAHAAFPDGLPAYLRLDDMVASRPGPR